VLLKIYLIVKTIIDFRNFMIFMILYDIYFDVL